jgi:hypothetical protein
LSLLATVTLIGFENRRPVVNLVRFDLADTVRAGAVHPTIDACPSGCGSHRAVFLGANEAAMDLARRSPHLLRSGNADSAVQLLQSEYSARPDVVGGPVSLVVIDKQGLHIIEKGACSS